MDNNCYKLKELKYNNGLFNDTVDATYIIHLENNGRFNNIMNQLSSN